MADGEIAGMFVQATGTGRSIVAGAAGSVLDQARADAQANVTSPLRVQQVGYLSVAADAVTLFAAKRRGLRSGFKASDEVVARVPRGSVRGARFEKGRILGSLVVAFDDGSGWVFEVPRVGNKTVDQAVAALQP